MWVFREVNTGVIVAKLMICHLPVDHSGGNKQEKTDENLLPHGFLHLVGKNLSFQSLEDGIAGPTPQLNAQLKDYVQLEVVNCVDP
jgi:hypothetical protein